VDVQDDSAVQKSVDPKALIGPHEPDMNPRVEVHNDQGSEEANQTPECGSSESKSDEVSDHQSQQSGDESEESDHELRIEDFPNEILEKILSNLSGINLLRCLILDYFLYVVVLYFVDTYITISMYSSCFSHL